MLKIIYNKINDITHNQLIGIGILIWGFSILLLFYIGDNIYKILGVWLHLCMMHALYIKLTNGDREG